MNFLKEGVTRTKEAIASHKRLSLTLLIIQVFFIVILSTAFLQGQISIMTDLQEMVGQIETANYDPDSLEAGDPFLQDALAVYESYTNLIKSFIFFFVVISLVFLFFDGILWSISHLILQKQRPTIKQALYRWLRYAQVFLVLFLPFSIISYFLLKNTFASGAGPEAFAEMVRLLGYVLLILIYVLFSAVLSLNIRPYKQRLEKVWHNAVMKIHYTLPTAVLIFLLIWGSLYLIQYALTIQLFSLLMLTTIVFMILLSAARIFWIAALQDEKNTY